LGKQTAARAGGGRKQTLSVVAGDDLDEIAHLRADGRLHTQAWVRKRMPPSVRDCGGRAAAKVYGRVKAGNIAASCASRRYRPSPPRAAAFAGRRRAQTVGCARRYTGRRSAVNGGARVCMRSLLLHSIILSIAFWRRRADLRVCAAEDVFGCAEGLCGAASAFLRGESG